MTQQHINLGTPPNGADGDTNRIAWDKAEANFNELFARPIAGGKNWLINGNFDIFQRGSSRAVSAATAEFYGPDRWIFAGIGLTGNFGIGGVTLGEIPGARYFMGFNISAVTGAAWAGQKIEGVHALAGQKATLSFWMRAGVAGKKVGVRVSQSFGSGGSPSASTSVEAGLVTLTTTFQKFTITVDVPSIAGKVIGSSGNDYLYLIFDFNGSGYGGAVAGQTGLFEWGQCQLEAGEVATAFEHRPRGLELALCQRYYEKSYNHDVVPGAASAPGSEHWFLFGVAGSTYAAGAKCNFKATKRAVPAVTVYSPVTGASGMIASAAPAADYAATVSDIGTSGFFAYSASVATNNINLSWQWSADAEL